jgi:hypothetical protein
MTQVIFIGVRSRVDFSNPSRAKQKRQPRKRSGLPLC